MSHSYHLSKNVISPMYLKQTSVTSVFFSVYVSLNFYIVTFRRENQLLERISLRDGIEITTCRYRGT
jgi:hypothetical protein